MITLMAVLLICAAGEAAAQSADEAYVGDRPGDVAPVTTSEFTGVPLVLKDGTVMMWSNAKADDKWVARAVFSKDSARTWSQPVDLFEFPSRPAQWGGQSSLVDDKGYVHFFGLEYYSFDFKDRSKAESYLWHVRYRDGGKTWDPVQRIDCGHKYIACCMGPFQTRTGRIIAPASGLSERSVGAFVSPCPYSDDHGATWKLPANEITTNTGARDWYESGNAEPTGIQLKDGRLWVVTRSQDGYQWESYSKDNGLTWDPARHTRFVSNQSQMTVSRLRDGRLLLLWNNCGAEALLPIKWQWAERAVIAVAISGDEGKTWRGYREIGRAVAPRVELCNPNVVEMPNGRLLVYAAGVFATVDPDFITRTDFSERCEQGVRRWSTLSSEGVSAVPDPDGSAGKVLKMVRPKADVTSAACLNFPFGRKGTLTMTLRVEPKFQGAHITLSDHYDLPGLARDACFPIQINNKGRIMLNGSGGTWLATPGDLTAGKWHELKFTWDCNSHEALLELDGQEIGRLRQYVCADGVCYLRLRSLAPAMDEAGMYVRSVSVRAGP